LATQVSALRFALLAHGLYQNHPPLDQTRPRLRQDTDVIRYQIGLADSGLGGYGEAVASQERFNHHVGTTKTELYEDEAH
jgi:hypothetical protein